MATDKLINQTQGDDIIDALSDIADNVGNITYGPQTSADKVVSMLGYAEAAEAASINPGDTLNQAIGKLEKKANDNATNVANKIDKLTNATAGDIATVTATGEIADSTVSIADSNTGLADSDTAVPTSKTVKTYVDSTATGISRYLGTITAASGLSTSAKKGDFYVVKTAWTGVHAGDEIIAEKDNPAQTIDGTNWSLLHNEADTDTKYQFGEGTTNGTFLVTPSDTGVAQPVPIKGLGSAAYTTADTSSLTNDNNHVPTSALAKTLLDAKVPTTRKVNNKALSSDITLSASDVSAVPSSNVTTTLPASSAAASTSKVMSEKLVYDTYVQNSDFVVAENNILYSLRNGAKNFVNLFDTISSRSCTATELENGGMRLACTNAVWTQYFVNINLKPATQYVLYTNMANFSGTSIGAISIRVQYKDEHGNLVQYKPTQTGEHTITFTTESTTDLKLSVLINDSDTARTQSIDIWIMICEKVIYDTDSSYVSASLPNCDLTRLTSEDRAALTEEIDDGAKNKCNWAAATVHMSQACSYTKTDSGLTIASTTSDGWGHVAYSIGTLPAGNYALSVKISSYSATSATCKVGVGTTADALASISGNGTVTFNFTKSSASDAKIYFYANYSASAIVNSYVASEIMICTKAAFAVSPKFVPYAKSNYSLTQYTEGCSLDTVAKSSGSLDDITKNSFAVYSGSVTGKPVDYDGNTSAFTGLCRTDVYNSSEAMQTLRRLSNNHTWVRTKSASTWNPWIKQGVAPYLVNSNTASVTNLLYDAAKACGLSPTAKIHSGMISVTTDTNGESLLVFFTYKHGVYADAQSITNRVISYDSAINNLGTFGVSGGTAPYNFSVMFFN